MEKKESHKQFQVEYYCPISSHLKKENILLNKFISLSQIIVNSITRTKVRANQT